MFKRAIFVTLCFTSAALAQDTTVQQSMPYTTCVNSLQAPSGATSAPTTTIDTDVKKEVQFPVADGKVTITCDSLTGQATMTHQK